MKLGALLLKGFQSRSKKRNAYSGRMGAARFGSARSSSHAPSRRIPRSQTALSKVALENETIETQLKGKSANTSLLKTPIVIAEQKRSQATGVSNLDFIRPDGKFRKSIEAFLRDQRSPHTRRAYGKDLNRFVKFLIVRKSEFGPENVDRAVLISYKDFLLSEGLLHTSIDRHLATLKSFFRWLFEDELIEKNHAESVRFLNPKRESVTKAFTDEEVGKILSLPDLYTRSGSLHYAVLMVLFYCGLRRSELCELRTSSVGLERGHRFLKLRGKGNSERIVVITEPVWTAMEHYLKMVRKNLKTDQALFSPVRNNRTFVKDKPIDASMVFYIVTHYAKKSGIQHRVSPHSCRATAISNARDHQVPDRAIQEFAGWASPSMITRYDKRKSALEKSAVHSISYGNEDRVMPAARELALISKS